MAKRIRGQYSTGFIQSFKKSQSAYICLMRKAFVQLHIAVFLAGFTAILGKLITLNEALLVWFRMAITCISLLTLLLATQKNWRVPTVQLWPLLGTGAVVALHWLFFYGSVKYGNISIAVVCIAASGFFTAFFEPLFFKTRLVAAEVVLGAIALVGIYIIFDFHPQYQRGIVFGLLSAVGSALFPIFNKQLLQQHNPQTMVLYEMAGGVLLLSLLLPGYLHYFPASYLLPTAQDWIWLLVLSLLCTVYSFILQLKALQILSPFTANLTYNLEPLYGIVLAFLFFKENKHVNLYFYAGVGLILLAVLLQMYRISHARKRNRPV
jgi:drug/metabolite transporter (DMT)-like permease